MRSINFLIPIVILVLAGLLSAIFIVDEREKVLILRFGQIKQEVTDPGLGFKIPLLDEVVRYEDRILTLETDLIQVTPDDQRRLDVDAFVMYRITDIKQFRQATGVGGEAEAVSQLKGILNSQMRAVLGERGVTSNTILSPERVSLMQKIRVRSDARASALGLSIVDVRLQLSGREVRLIVAEGPLHQDRTHR